MGILASEKAAQTSPVAIRRKSTGLDLSGLKPLNATSGTKNFGAYRDPSQQSPKSKKKSADAMDSDAEDEDDVKVEDDDDDKDIGAKGMLSPDDALRQGELAEGVRKIKVTIMLFTIAIINTNIHTVETPTFCRTLESSYVTGSARWLRVSYLRRSNLNWRCKRRSLIFGYSKIIST